jgi:hypothetical protein
MDVDAAARRSTEVELAAEAVHHSNAHLVALDRRLNQTREGIRAIKKGDCGAGGVWVLCPGGVFVLAPSSAKAMEHLEADMALVGQHIQAERETLKSHVVELARLEGPDSALATLNQGFHLRDVRAKV